MSVLAAIHLSSCSFWNNTCTLILSPVHHCLILCLLISFLLIVKWLFRSSRRFCMPCCSNVISLLILESQEATEWSSCGCNLCVCVCVFIFYSQSLLMWCFLILWQPVSFWGPSGSSFFLCCHFSVTATWRPICVLVVGHPHLSFRHQTTVWVVPRLQQTECLYPGVALTQVSLVTEAYRPWP